MLDVGSASSVCLLRSPFSFLPSPLSLRPSPFSLLLPPNHKRRPDRSSCIPCRCGKVHPFERRSQIHLAIRDRIHRAAARQGEVRAVVFLVESIEQGEE